MGDQTPLPVEDTMEEEIQWKIQRSIPYHTIPYTALHNTTPAYHPYTILVPNTKHIPCAYPVELTNTIHLETKNAGVSLVKMPHYSAV